MRCKRWFSERYTKGHHKPAFVKRIVNTYFDTRGSYRRTAKSVDYRLSHMQVFRIIEKLGNGCKDNVQVARELHPRWSGILGLDGKTIDVGGENKVLVDAVDLGTQDSVDSALVASEDHPSLCVFLEEVRDRIGYSPSMLVIDDDRAWRAACETVFPGVAIQLCVVHFERVVDRILPKRKRTPEQEEFKQMVRGVLYAKSRDAAGQAMDEILEARRRKRFTGRKVAHIVVSLIRNFELLTARFRARTRYRDNNITEGVNDKLQMKLFLIRGFKKEESARNTLKLIVMHYRFNPFSSCKIKENNGKSPLNLAGVDTSRLDWVAYSQGSIFSEGQANSERAITLQCLPSSYALPNYFGRVPRSTTLQA
jgi:transposase-like protein